MGKDTWRKLSLVCQGSYLWLSPCPCQLGSTCCVSCWIQSTANQKFMMLLFLSSFTFFFLAPATVPSPPTFWVSRLLSPPFWHQQLGHSCQSTLGYNRCVGWVCQHTLRVITPHFQRGGSGVHLQTALAEPSPQTLLFGIKYLVCFP